MRTFIQFIAEGVQTFIGHASEGAAALSLLDRHVDPKHHGSEANMATRSKANAMIEKARAALSPDEFATRISHGHAMADEMHKHMQELYPEHEIHEVHITNKDGDIKKATRGKHNDSDKINPSDVTVGLIRKKNKSKAISEAAGSSDDDVIHHGFSLKSTQGSGDIGFKNPSPTHMDRELGTNVISMFKGAQEELETHHPELKGLPDKSNSKLSKADIIKGSPEVKKTAKMVADKHYAKIRDHVVETLNGHLKSEEGHERVKAFLRNNYLNADSNSMPYSKVTAMGTAKKGVKAKTEIVSESRTAALLKDPRTRIHVSKGGGNSYIHYHATDPDTGEKVHLFSEQVKTSSGFGYSSPRHNIQPPGKHT